MSLLQVSDHKGVLVVDSRLIAARLGIEHATLLKTIDKYLDRLQAKSPVRFEIDVVKRPQGGTYNVRYAYLDERQSTLLMTYSRNTEQVLDCKDELVDAFEKAKQLINKVIPAQNDRIRELELELAIRRMDSDMLTMHGKEVVLTLRGMSNQLVEVEKPMIEVIDERSGTRFKGQTTKQVAEYLNKRSGLKLSSGADVMRRLKAASKDNLIGQITRPIKQDYIPEKNLAEVYRILESGDRQRLIGE